MKKVTVEDLIGLSAYEKVRDQFREEIIRHKKSRRLAIGDRLSLVFEDRKTVLFQIQEMLRAERITDLDKIKQEVEVYNSLIPNSDELSATLFLEIEDQNTIRQDLLKFSGIDEALYLNIGSRRMIRALFEEGHSKEDKISAVQYVRFCLDAEARAALIQGTERIAIVVEHPSYRAEAEIGEPMRHSLCHDLVE